MPRYPKASSAVGRITGSVFSALAHRIAHHEGEVYPLHVGDTWVEPVEGCRMEDLDVRTHPGMHRYAPPQGMPSLLDAIVERCRQRSGVATERDNVLVATGATGALGAVMGAILEPADEVLIHAPYWPLISGIVRCFGGVPVDVPLTDAEGVPGVAATADDAVEAFRLKKTDATVAVYLSTPNNPSGRVMPRAQVEAICAWADAEDLWIVADEVYEDYVFRGEHRYARAVAPERTFSAHSFSKAFGMAGNRCGYVIGPAAMVRELCKISTHSFYSTPTASQIAGTRVLDGRGDAWVRQMRERYREVGDRAAKRLGMPLPEGSTFLFLDVASRLDERGLLGFLEDCADRGLFLAPGPSFGPYPSWVRVCYTCAPPDVVDRGVEVLADMLAV